MRDAALTVQDLNKVYQNREGPAGGVRDTSFTLEPGTFFTLLGPSGCGKTTTLRSVAGLETPDRGRIALGEQVFFDAANGIDVPLNHRRIGMVFQSYAIWPHMTVFENVAFPLRVDKSARVDRATLRQTVGQALEMVSLAGFENRSAARLSGGQQQRIALARAIVRKPRLLLLDEPLSNLDATLREEMRTELKRLQRQIGVTTIYVTHDQAEALDMSDRIAVLDHGRIVQIGSPREIYFRPRNEFVATFVGATNLVRGTVAGDAVADTVAPVALEDGTVLHCLFPQAARTGAPVAISIRPESLALGPVTQPVPDGSNRMEGTVVSNGFLGTLSRYGVRVGGSVMHANAAAETTLPVGGAAGDLSKPDAERLAALRLGFFAPGHDPTPWLHGWWPAAQKMEADSREKSGVKQSEWWSAGKAPLLELIPGDDPFKPRDKWGELAADYGARVTTVVIPDASHALFPEQPDAIAEAVLKWIPTLPP